MGKTLVNESRGRYHSIQMDNLPKKPGDDPFSFTGTYPKAGDEPEAPEGMTGMSSTPASEAAAPDVPPEPFAPPTPEPQVPGAPVVSTFAETTPAAVPFPTPPGTGEPMPPPPAAPESPFVVPAASAATGGAGKRILGLLILFIVLIVIGFVAFKVIGRLLARNQPVVLTYWGLWENEAILTGVIAEYKKTHPNVEISYSMQSPKQYRERLQAAIERGEGPDIFRYHATWVPMLKDDLAPAGKTGYTAAEFQQAFYPVAARDLVIGGRVYGVPLMLDGLGLYYNEDLLRAGGIIPPTTWEDFREAALSLTVKDENDQIITSGAALGTTGNVEHFSDIMALMMLQNGADLKNPTGKEAQDALSFYHLFTEKPNQVWNETLDNSIIAFANGKVAFIFAPSWWVHNIRLMNPNLRFQIIPVPQLPGTNTTWASYWAEGVSAKSSHQDEAWEFLKFLSSKETLISLYTEASKTRVFGEPYSRVDLAQTIANDPYVGAYIRQAQTAESFFLAGRTFDNGINDRMIKYLSDAVNSLGQGVSPESAVETVAQGFSQVLSSFGATAR